MAALRVTHEKGARKAEEGVRRELGQVLGELNHTRETLRLEEEERKKLESEVGAVRAELVRAEKSKEVEDVEMGGTGLPSQKTMVDAATNMETTRTYTQAAAQSQAERRERMEKGKGRCTSPEVRFANLPQRHAVVEDLSEYEEEEEETRGTMAKTIVVHGVPTDWRIGGVAGCVERITGRVIGVRWLLGAERWEGKTALSVVVYLDKEVFLGAEVKIRMVGMRCAMVPYRWRI